MQRKAIHYVTSRRGLALLTLDAFQTEEGIDTLTPRECKLTRGKIAEKNTPEIQFQLTYPNNAPSACGGGSLHVVGTILRDSLLALEVKADAIIDLSTALRASDPCIRRLLNKVKLQV